MQPTRAGSSTAPSTDNPIPLEAILRTEELSQRPSRPPDHRTGNRALLALADALAASPRTVLQTLADQVLEVLQADSAGLSLLTKDQTEFYWAAISGLWAPHAGGGTPRNFGPCGDVLDRNAPLLFTRWERRYPYLAAATPPAREGLLVPFYLEGRAVGTIWAIAHDADRKFDAEDLRQLESLGRFAAAACQFTAHLHVLDERESALQQSRSEITQVLESRSAALNLMEDAVRARHLADELNAQLNREVGERRRAQKALKEADRRKNEFLAILSHELRNPLAPLRSVLDVMSMTEPDSAGAADSRATMERQLNRLTRLVDDLLEITRLTQGKLQLRKSQVELAAVVQHAAEDTRDLMGEGRHELVISLPREPVVVSADPFRLGQVLTNLLSNAAKYTPPGGRIEVSAERCAEGVQLAVCDNGCGIPPDQLETIFEMFSQVEAAPEKGQNGLGVGLSLAKSLVEMHGGTIEARSDGPGRGSEIRFWLPIGPETSALPAEPESAEVTRVRKIARRVLVVDDNTDAAQSLTMLLKTLGHELRTAYDGLEAVEVAKAFRPQLVLLDIGLPGLNGYEVAGEIRAQPWGKEVVLAALTGWGQDSDRLRAKEVGFDHHFIKPVKVAALEALLETLPA